MRDQMKVIGFAAAVCLVCSILLAVVSSALSPRQELNKANDVKSKVMQVFGVPIFDESGTLSVEPEQLDRMFTERIEGVVLDSEGEVVSNRTVASLSPQEISDVDKATGLKTFYPLYIYTDPESGEKTYAVHVSGKGLWSTIKGFMALEPDLSTISAIVFYEHQETPGLGGEVEKPYFQDRFKGKKWRSDGEINDFEITKPGNADNDHSVDGITAATMTCRGVEDFLNADYRVYDQYFQKLRDQS